MERIQKIRQHPLYQEQFALLQKAEENRIFCRHTMEHFLDVARLMYIYNLEEKAGTDPELIYASALLHDIGRYEQLTVGIPHEESGARISGVILDNCGFSFEEIHRVQQAILSHRSKSDDLPETDPLAGWLQKADKQSRNCFCCPAASACNWPETKKNKEIIR
jgi:putative nucleotidyltransferase with HDIG domain